MTERELRAARSEQEVALAVFKVKDYEVYLQQHYKRLQAIVDQAGAVYAQAEANHGIECARHREKETGEVLQFHLDRRKAILDQAAAVYDFAKATFEIDYAQLKSQLHSLKHCLNVQKLSFKFLKAEADKGFD